MVQISDIISGYGTVTEITDKMIVFENNQHPGCERIIITIEDGKQLIKRITSKQNYSDFNGHNISSENLSGELPNKGN